MKRLHNSSDIPKYISGKWYWSAQEERIAFLPYTDLEYANDEYIKTNGYKFRRTLNQIEELLYRQEFARSSSACDSHVIVTKDVRNVVLFMMPSSFINRDFIIFLHTLEVEMFWTTLIIYFEYFLGMVEFVLIRRDEIKGEKLAHIQSTQSTQVKRIFSSHLSQYRLLLAREYSKIIIGDGEMQRYHHIRPGTNISMTLYDKMFHEQFLACSTQVVWIAMHRRAYDYINMEMTRLFRSEHFNLEDNSKIQFTRAEREMLYGENNRLVNYRAQNSPLILELMHVAEENLPILWIGKRKYRGTDIRIATIELEYLVPDSQLALIDVVHGILGHPKNLYNSILQIDWAAVRYCNYTESNDPYHILRQPSRKWPNLNENALRKYEKTFEHFYELKMKRVVLSAVMLEKLMQRDYFIEHAKKEGKLLTSVWRRAEWLIAGKEPEGFAQTLQRHLRAMTFRAKTNWKTVVGNVQTANLVLRHFSPNS